MLLSSQERSNGSCGRFNSDEHDGDRVSNLADATRGMPLPPGMCPRCGETQQVERIGHEYYCSTCSMKWPVVNVAMPPGQGRAVLNKIVAAISILTVVWLAGMWVQHVNDALADLQAAHVYHYGTPVPHSKGQ